MSVVTIQNPLYLLDKVQSKSICLINNHNLTKSLKRLSHRCLVGDLSIFYRCFHRHCCQKIKGIFSCSSEACEDHQKLNSFKLVPSFTAYFTNSIQQIIIHPKNLQFTMSHLVLRFLNLTTCLLSNYKSNNLIKLHSPH